MAERPSIARIPKVLFVCYGNTCRSVLAQYISRDLFGALAHFESAGLHPQSAGDARMAIETLKTQYGIDASGHKPRSAKYVGLSTFDVIVALDGDVKTTLDIPASVLLEEWTVADPYGRPDEYVACSLRIEAKLKDLGRRLASAP